MPAKQTLVNADMPVMQTPVNTVGHDTDKHLSIHTSTFRQTYLFVIKIKLFDEHYYFYTNKSPSQIIIKQKD